MTHPPSRLYKFVAPHVLSCTSLLASKTSKLPIIQIGWAGLASGEALPPLSDVPLHLIRQPQDIFSRHARAERSVGYLLLNLGYTASWIPLTIFVSHLMSLRIYFNFPIGPESQSQ
jgi:hypothetical protein